MPPLGDTSPDISALPFAGEPTTVAAYTQAIARALEFKGVDSAPLFRAAGLAEHYGTDPLQRVPISRMNHLFALCVAATNDPYFGLTVGDMLQVASLHALGQSLTNSQTLMHFGDRLVRYFRLLSEVATMRLDVGDRSVALVTSNVVATSAETQDAWLAFLVRFVRQLTRDAVNPLQVDFVHAMPPEGPGPYEHYFRCPVRFGQNDNVLVFDRALFDQRLESSSPELAAVNDRIVADYIGRLDRNDLVTHVRLQIVARLDSDNCDRDTIARDLGMAPATLARRLMQRDSSFQNILNDTRRELAQGYLQQPHLPVTEVAFRLGFSDLSNFTRAFKQWTGQSPSEFRAGAATA